MATVLKNGTMSSVCCGSFALQARIATAASAVERQSGNHLADQMIAAPTGGGTGSVGAKVLSELEEAFIDIMGPIGVLILNDRYSGLSYVRGETIIAKNYHALLSFIVDELPEAKKTAFLEKFRRN